MKERTILNTSLTEIAFTEILRESFQDFELNGYKSTLHFNTGIIDNTSKNRITVHKNYN